MTAPQPTTFERAEATADPDASRRALAGASTVPYWLDTPERPDAMPPLTGTARADLCVVGAGYTGLWTALIAKERDPDLDVVLIEAQRVAWAASGRNGGFCEASLTHGRANGELHLPDELELLERLGHENLDELVATVERYGIDCDLERTGVLGVATEPHQVDELRAEVAARGGSPDEVLTGDALRTELASPIAHAAATRHGDVMIDPAKLAFGLRRACLDLGVRIYEHTPATGLERHGDRMRVVTRDGEVDAAKVALATNVFPSLLRWTRWLTVPIYDYAIVTEPLTPEQRASIGWAGRQGIADMNSRFHYIRLIADPAGDRILFGGYDAIYHYGRRVRARYDRRPESFERLATHFRTMFPQLAAVRFTHAWGGAIDTCSRFFSFFATGFGGRVAHVAGFTGLGVGATRFGAKVMLDLLSARETELTRLEFTRKTPFPFPPDPITWLAVKVVYGQMAEADRRGGRRGLLLRVLDFFKLGFDS